MTAAGAPFTGRRVEKPWGFELIWAETAAYVGKILHIERGHQLSYQYHRVKDETIHVLAGVLESGSRRGHRAAAADCAWPPARASTSRRACGIG